MILVDHFDFGLEEGVEVATKKFLWVKDLL